ncbi:MAG: hypothetical protein ACM3TU_00265 [Bacillota bacterium]
MRAVARFSLVLSLVVAVAFPCATLAEGTSTPVLDARGTPYYPPSTQKVNLTAQAASAVKPQATSTTRVDTAGLTSCFDYYKFNSTPVVVSADLSSVIAGAPLGVTLTVTNENPYPIVDAKVYVKVMRYGYAKGEKNVNAPDIVDFFPAGDPVSIPAGGHVNLSTAWQVPQDAEAGDYMMAAYVVSADRFEMEGLTFTDDVIGSAFNFHVVNDTKGSVRFDKNSATVLNQPFRFAAYPPRIPSNTKDVPVGIDVVNTTPLPVTEEVTWTLYKWDALRADQALDRKTETVTVPGNGRVHVAYTVTDTNHSVYYLLGAVRSAGGSSSLAGIRFVRGDVNEPRLNYVGVTGYPAGKGISAFACVHSTGPGTAENTKLELVATRPSFFGIGGTLAKKTYQGPAAGDIRALVVPFSGSADSFAVTARLFQNGVLVDQVTENYSCADLSPDSCAKRTIPLVPLAIGLGAFVIIVIVAAFIIIRRKKAPATPVTTVPPTV